MQADEGGEKRKRSFRRFQFRGVDLEQLLELSLDDLLDLFHARARRKCVLTLTWCSVAQRVALGSSCAARAVAVAPRASHQGAWPASAADAADDSAHVCIAPTEDPSAARGGFHLRATGRCRLACCANALGKRRVLAAWAMAVIERLRR